MAESHDNAPRTQGAGGESKAGQDRRDPMWTVAELLKWTQTRFAEVGIESPRTDAEHLLAEALGCTRVSLYVRHDEVVPSDAKGAFRTSVKRRLAREPVAYVLGRRGFHALDLELAVDRRVLVPRPDTEHLVDWVLEELRPPPAPIATILDIGTGSGAIALALKKARADTAVTASDVSEDALVVAAANVSAVGVEVDLVCADLFDGVQMPPGGWDVVVSNPPYIPTGDLVGLQAEVRDHEPSGALDGGEDGLDVIRRIVADAPPMLRAGGKLYLEVGIGQHQAVRSLLEQAGFTDVDTRADFGGVARVVRGTAARG